MSDQASLDEGQADQGTQGSDQHDWEKDYKELQATYTRQQQELKDEQAAWDDERAVLARIAEKHPHLMTDEEEEPAVDDDEDNLFVDDETTAKLTELEKRQQAHDEFIARQAQKEATEQFNADLAELAGDRTIHANARKWIFTETIELGDGKNNLEKAYKAWVEFEDGLRAEAKADYLKTKRGPTPPTPGKGGEEQRNPRDRNARRATMAAAIAAAQSDQ